MNTLFSLLVLLCLAGFAGAGVPAEFDGLSGKNILWKTPLPNWGNGSPVVVAGKVFVVCEAGWLGEGKPPRDAKEVRDNLDPYPVYHNGKLYLQQGQVWDAATGAVLEWHADRGNPPLGIQGVVLAGNLLLGHAGTVQAKDVRVAVTPLDKWGLTGETKWMLLEKRDGNPAWQTDEWKAKVKAETGTDGLLSLWHGWHPSFALPVVAGDRLFIRTFDNLWCIGSKL